MVAKYVHCLNDLQYTSIIILELLCPENENGYYFDHYGLSVTHSEISWKHYIEQTSTPKFNQQMELKSLILVDYSGNVEKLFFLKVSGKCQFLAVMGGENFNGSADKSGGWWHWNWLKLRTNLNLKSSQIFLKHRIDLEEKTFSLKRAHKSKFKNSKTCFETLHKSYLFWCFPKDRSCCQFRTVASFTNIDKAIDFQEVVLPSVKPGPHWIKTSWLNQFNRKSDVFGKVFLKNCFLHRCPPLLLM